MAADVTQGGIGEPASHAFSVTPNDGADLAFVTRAVWVGVGGSLSVVMQGGETVLIEGIAAGSLLPIRVSRIRATLTTAMSILGLY